MRLILTCTHTCSKVIHNVLLAQEVFQKDAPPAYEQDGPAPVAFNFDRQIRLYMEIKLSAVIPFIQCPWQPKTFSQ